MANFARVSNQLEGIINSQLNATRITQGVWEWYNALARIVSANYVTGTVTVSGPTLSDDSGTAVDLEAASAVKVYGVIVDNPNAAEATWLQFYDIASASVTVGTSLFKLALFNPSASITTWVFPSGAVF